jgi:putative ABC transport system permease protein
LETFVIPINAYDLAFLGTIFLGSGLAVLLWIAERQNKAANRLLALALLIIVFFMVRLLAIDIRLSAHISYRKWIPLQFSMGFGPLIFFYVLKITRPKYKFKPKGLLHLIPLAAELGIQLVFPGLYPLWQFAAFVSLIVYLYAAHKLIETFYRRIKFINGDRYRTEMKCLRRLLRAFGILCLCLIFFITTSYFFYSNGLPVQTYYPFALLLAILTIATACITLLKPEYGLTSPSTLSLKPHAPSELKQKGIWLKKMLKVNRYYEDPELNLPSLAEKTGLHPNELSKIVNTVLHKNFNDFINEYRIAEVVRRMQDPSFNHLTLVGIAFESGFNSKTTFNRAFKKMTGRSPADYKNKHIKERPNYNLERPVRFATVISYQETAQNWTGKKQIATSCSKIISRLPGVT